jgi:hypothetical protein
MRKLEEIARARRKLTQDGEKVDVFHKLATSVNAVTTHTVSTTNGSM